MSSQEEKVNAKSKAEKQSRRAKPKSKIKGTKSNFRFVTGGIISYKFVEWNELPEKLTSES
jgi:hypothetical protein